MIPTFFLYLTISLSYVLLETNKPVFIVVTLEGNIALGNFKFVGTKIFMEKRFRYKM